MCHVVCEQGCTLCRSDSHMYNCCWISLLSVVSVVMAGASAIIVVANVMEYI